MDRVQLYDKILNKCRINYGRCMFEQIRVKFEMKDILIREEMEESLNCFSEEEILDGFQWMVSSDDIRFPTLHLLVRSIVKHKLNKRDICIGKTDDDPDYDPYYDDPAMRDIETPKSIGEIMSTDDFWVKVTNTCGGKTDG